MHWKTYWQFKNKTSQYEIGALEGQVLALERLYKMVGKIGQRRTKKQ
jgi:hypothetical protein